MDYLTAVKMVVQQIVSSEGEVSASKLVDAARPEHSPAHGAFEWDDAKAGEEYRLSQARKYLRKVSVTVEDGKQSVRLINVPVFKESQTREGTYKPISSVVLVEDEYERALRQLLVKLETLQAAYDDLVAAAERKEVPVPEIGCWINSIRGSLEESRA